MGQQSLLMAPQNVKYLSVHHLFMIPFRCLIQFAVPAKKLHAFHVCNAEADGNGRAAQAGRKEVS